MHVIDYENLIEEVEGKPVQWVEVIECINGGISSGSFQDEDGNVTPVLHDDFAECEKERIDMVETYQTQIADGERDEGDEWEGIVYPCYLDGKEVVLLDLDALQGGTVSEVNRYDWKDAAGL